MTKIAKSISAMLLTPILLTNAFAFPVVVPAIAQDGVGNQDVRSPQFRLNPQQGLQGKDYPFTLSSLSANCGTQKTFDDVTLVSGSAGVSVQIDEGRNSCALTGTLHISGSADFGTVDLKVIKTKDANGKATKQLIDIVPFQVVAQIAGPIPPGLSPQVDVTWKVLPRRVASDGFGARIAKLYYAIEVVIGNNSGYDLQIAAINFQLPHRDGITGPIPTDAYRTVRDSLQTEQAVGFRNTFVNAVNALGPVLAGATFFFRGSTPAAANHKSIYQGFVNVFSNPFEKGLDLIFPDKTVSQLIQLDNQMLRDGMIIPNNIQQRTLVFMSRDVIQKSPKDFGRARGSKAGSAAKTDEQAFNDLRQRLKSTMKSEFEPQEVMRQLGQLVLIGNQVKYLNRVRVVSTTLPTVGGPIVAKVSVSQAEQGATDLAVTFDGERLDGARLLAPEKSGLTIGSTTLNADGTSMTVNVSVAADATPGNLKLTLATTGGIQSIPFKIAGAPVFDTSSGVSGASGAAGTPATVTVTGTYLDSVDPASFTVPDGSKLTVANVTPSSDGKTLTFTVTSDPATPKATYEISFKSRGGKALSVNFVVS